MAAGRRLEKAKDGAFVVGRKKGNGLAADIWQRNRTDPFGKPTLLIFFSQTSRYPKAPTSSQGWNDSVRRAGNGTAEPIRRRLTAQGGA